MQTIFSSSASRAALSLLFALSMSGCKNLFDSSSLGSSTADSGFAPGLSALPGSFQILSLKSENGSVLVTFALSENASAYNLYYKLSGSGSYSRVSSVTSPYRLAGLQNNSAYEFYVEATNERGSKVTDVAQVTPANQSGRVVEQVVSGSKVIMTGRGYKTVFGVSNPTSLPMSTTSRGYKIQLGAQGVIAGGAL